jgi:hypothetical protein
MNRAEGRIIEPIVLIEDEGVDFSIGFRNASRYNCECDSHEKHGSSQTEKMTRFLTMWMAAHDASMFGRRTKR